MLSMQKFAGINNVLQPHELAGSDLAAATNVDVDLAGRLRRRSGYTVASATQHANVWEGDGVTFATRGAAGDLVELVTDTVVRAGIGHARVHYVQFPGGLVGWSNGAACGMFQPGAAVGRAWGIPVPTAFGLAVDTAGNLHPGDYQYSLTHVRLSDGQEGGAGYYNGVVSVASGGIAFGGLPVPTGYKTNVYLTSHYGGERYLAGSTTTGSFTFTGKNKDLVLACLTDFMNPAPVGSLLAFWRGRALVAVGNALFTSQMHSWELFDLRRDFKQFSAPITMLVPADDGIWVGTSKELSFLNGKTFDALVRNVKINGPVVLGSGISVPGEYLRGVNGPLDGECMVCIADNWLVAGSPHGDIMPLSANRYKVSASEVCAAFRVVDGIPQYLAAVQ